MLRRVVVENYIIFKGRQELDLESTCGSSFHTLVGENSSGKSSFVALVKAASNFVDNSEDNNNLQELGKILPFIVQEKISYLGTVQ